MTLEQIDANTQLKNNNPSGGITTIPFVNYISTMPITGNSFPFSATIDRTVTFVRFAIAVLVLSTSDASNYYTIRLKRVLDDAIITSVTTNSASPNTYILLTDETFSISGASASDVGLYIDTLVEGSPGNMYMGSPILEITT